MTQHPTACLVSAGGEVFHGCGFGATGETVAELVFNTAMSGYQEILSDPCSTAQVVTFTFPHIGDVGVNPQDDAAGGRGAAGLVVRWLPSAPSNWRAVAPLGEWMAARGCIGIGGVDTRRLTRQLRDHGSMPVALAHDPQGKFDIDAMRKRAGEWAGIAGADLAREVACRKPFSWTEGVWSWPDGFGPAPQPASGPRLKVAAIDFGVTRDLLRSIAQSGAEITVFPATATADEVLAAAPDGVFLSGGPGDPAATADYAVPQIKALLDHGLPIFAVGLGHQLLARALGASTVQLHHGHHGANHPVRDTRTGLVEITAMNHGFAVDAATLPGTVRETHVSLFDGSNCGLEVEGRPVFSLQHHPAWIPGLLGSSAPFDRFADNMRTARKAA